MTVFFLLIWVCGVQAAASELWNVHCLDGLEFMENLICYTRWVSSYAFRQKIKNNENIGIDVRRSARCFQARFEQNGGSKMIDLLSFLENLWVQAFVCSLFLQYQPVHKGSWRKSLTRSGP